MIYIPHNTADYVKFIRCDQEWLIIDVLPSINLYLSVKGTPAIRLHISHSRDIRCGKIPTAFISKWYEK